VAQASSPEGLARRPNRHGPGVSCAGLLGQAQGCSTRAIALTPRPRAELRPPGHLGRPAWLACPPQRFQDTGEPVEGAQGRQPMGGSGVCPGPCATRGLCRAPGRERAAPGRRQAQPALAHSLLSGTGETRLRQRQAQCLWPSEATAHGLSDRTSRAPFDLLPSPPQGPAPGRDLSGRTTVRLESGTESLVGERANLRPQGHIQMAFGESGLDHDCGGRGNRGERRQPPGHVAPPCMTTTTGLSAREEE
jgi:hypothetical protein